MSKKPYGTYAIAAFDRDTAKEKKLEILKDVIQKLIDSIGKCKFEPDLNTLQLIIKEDFIWQSDDLTWYEHEEKGPEPSMPFWGMTIGIKLYEREEKNGGTAGDIRTDQTNAQKARNDGTASYGCVYEGTYEGPTGL